MVVCVAAESVYQDVRVLRLDEIAAAIVDGAHRARSVTELEAVAAAAAGVPGDADGMRELLDGLVAARVLERTGT